MSPTVDEVKVQPPTPREDCGFKRRRVMLSRKWVARSAGPIDKAQIVQVNPENA